MKPKSTTKRIIRKAIRTVAGPDTKAELFVRDWGRYRVREVDSAGILEKHGVDFLLIRPRGGSAAPRGVYLFGGCDLPSLYRMVPLVRDGLNGPIAFHQPPGGLGASRSDRQLQLLDEGVPSDAEELTERLHLPPRYFEPQLFERTFSISLPNTPAFPKDVIALSGAADIIRPLYRRKSTGTLVDPGGWWLNQSVDAAVNDQDTLRWFKTEFEPVGRLGPDEFAKNFERYIGEIRDRTGTSAILVFNTLTVEPADPTHNYQFRPKAEAIRRRTFLLTLQDLADRAGFHVVDVDRTLKVAGIDEQLDFAHFPEYAYDAVAAEAHEILTPSVL